MFGEGHVGVHAVCYNVGLKIAPNGIVLLLDEQGKPVIRGIDAFVEFCNTEIAGQAMERHKEKIGHRWESGKDGKDYKSPVEEHCVWWDIVAERVLQVKQTFAFNCLGGMIGLMSDESILFYSPSVTTLTSY